MKSKDDLAAFPIHTASIGIRPNVQMQNKAILILSIISIN